MSEGLTRSTVDHPDSSHRPGLRGRIVTPTPPAPVPKIRPKPVAASVARLDTSLIPSPAGGAPQRHASAEQSDSDVARSTGSMAVATLLSRITGFLRNVLLVATIGPAIGSAFLTANTLPNLITEVVLGAVLTALVVPVLVRAEKEDPDKGEAFIRRLFTLSMTLLILVTTASVIAAPLLASLPLKRHGDVNIVQATSFAYLLLPQILFYGIFALFMAILNTKGIFKPGAWAPVVNNIIVLVVLGLYWLLPGGLAPDAAAGVTNPHIALLGLGTTAGVVIQALIMVPYLKKAGVNLAPLWGIDDRLKQFGGMAAAIVVYVAISQVGYIVATRIASAADDRAPTIYQQAWLLLQVPYGIIGVTLLTAIMPRLSRHAADGDHKAVVHDLGLGMKLTLVSLIPIIAFMTAFGTQIANALFAYGKFTHDDANILGWTLSFSAFGLIPYAMVLLHLRVFYAREQAWTPTLIIVGITGTKILLSMAAPLVATDRSKVVVLLATANAFGFIAGAVIGGFLLRRQLGSLGGSSILRTSLWTTGASVAAGLIVVALDFGVVAATGGDPNHFGSLGYFVRTAVFGVVFLAIVGLILAKSGLDEIATMRAQLGRLPVVGRRFAPPPTEDGAAESAHLDAPTAQEMTSQILTVEPFDASAVPPPMSAGVVRGPRLVPGAPICDGRFRLLADHGRVPGAHFWQALDNTTGQMKALVFVDTTGPAHAPRAAAEAAQRAAVVADDTVALGRLDHAAVASDIDVITYRTGCIITADWVPGSALATVADDGADPRAACWALSHVASAAADAHAAGLVLGLDHVDRIRIATDGTAVLAFPAVLDSDTQGRDVAAIGGALQRLCDAAPEVPEKITALINRTLAATAAKQDNEQSGAIITAAGLYDTLVDQSFAGTVAPDDANREKISISADTTPTPGSVDGGFGSGTYSHKATAVIVALSIALVLLAAGLAIYVMGLFNQGKPDNPIKPVNPISTITGADGTAGPNHSDNPLAAEPALIIPAGVTEWQPKPTPPGFEDNPKLAPLAADANFDTVWQTDVYRDQFAAPPAGTKEGVGLLVALPMPTDVSRVVVTSPTPGAHLTIYGVPPAVPAGEFSQLNQAIELGQLTTTTASVTADTPAANTVTRVLVWVDKLPASPHQAKIGEVAVFGTPAPQ